MDMIRVEDFWLCFNIHFYNQRVTMRRYLIEHYQRIMRQEESPARNSDESGGSLFWGLKGISFTARQGEIIGLIGHNGAGKSILLMSLAGIYKPDRGTVQVQGSIGTLLSLGAGFHNELSGRENIEYNAIFMGMSPRQIQERMEQIVEYAELGKFIDAPLKTYSSGMRARLGFSIAINLDPDILLIDEVLETGDAAFREKSGNLLEHYKARGKTIVIASHNAGAIRSLCTRALLVDHGRLISDGPVDDVIEHYKDLVGKHK
jgi:ABC-type polysaccharide/polyol phosphate transport system ATPase subunit